MRIVRIVRYLRFDGLVTACPRHGVSLVDLLALADFRIFGSRVLIATFLHLFDEVDVRGYVVDRFLLRRAIVFYRFDKQWFALGVRLEGLVEVPKALGDFALAAQSLGDEIHLLVILALLNILDRETEVELETGFGLDIVSLRLYGRNNGVSI